MPSELVVLTVLNTLGNDYAGINHVVSSSGESWARLVVGFNLPSDSEYGAMHVARTQVPTNAPAALLIEAHNLNPDTRKELFRLFLHASMSQRTCVVNNITISQDDIARHQVSPFVSTLLDRVRSNARVQRGQPFVLAFTPAVLQYALLSGKDSSTAAYSLTAYSAGIGQHSSQVAVPARNISFEHQELAVVVPNFEDPYPLQIDGLITTMNADMHSMSGQVTRALSESVKYVTFVLANSEYPPISPRRIPRFSKLYENISMQLIEVNNILWQKSFEQHGHAILVVHFLGYLWKMASAKWSGDSASLLAGSAVSAIREDSAPAHITYLINNGRSESVPVLANMLLAAFSRFTEDATRALFVRNELIASCAGAHRSSDRVWLLAAIETPLLDHATLAAAAGTLFMEGGMPASLNSFESRWPTLFTVIRGVSNGRFMDDAVDTRPYPSPEHALPASLVGEDASILPPPYLRGNGMRLDDVLLMGARMRALLVVYEDVTLSHTVSARAVDSLQSELVLYMNKRATATLRLIATDRNHMPHERSAPLLRSFIDTAVGFSEHSLHRIGHAHNAWLETSNAWAVAVRGYVMTELPNLLMKATASTLTAEEMVHLTRSEEMNGLLTRIDERDWEYVESLVVDWYRPHIVGEVFTPAAGTIALLLTLALKELKNDVIAAKTIYGASIGPIVWAWSATRDDIMSAANGASLIDIIHRELVAYVANALSTREIAQRLVPVEDEAKHTKVANTIDTGESHVAAVVHVNTTRLHEASPKWRDHVTGQDVSVIVEVTVNAIANIGMTSIAHVVSPGAPAVMALENPASSVVIDYYARNRAHYMKMRDNILSTLQLVLNSYNPDLALLIFQSHAFPNMDPTVMARFWAYDVFTLSPQWHATIPRVPLNNITPAHPDSQPLVAIDEGTQSSITWISVPTPRAPLGGAWVTMFSRRRRNPIPLRMAMPAAGQHTTDVQPVAQPAQTVPIDTTYSSCNFTRVVVDSDSDSCSDDDDCY